MKKYLITGCTGTMGQAVTRLILNKIPNAFVIGISRDEQKQRLLPTHERVFYKLADIRDPQSITRAIGREIIIDCVIHLAALKCVDTLESNVNEAIQTNVTGTQNMVDFADDFGCDLVMASTDKACYPVNTYGASKALAERIVASADYKICRYGNVIGSRGSFIPHIVECLKQGVSIPVTDRRMTRFWIKTEDVASFILDVANEPRRGQVYLPPAIFSCPIVTLIKSIAEILGVEKYTLRDVGLRPGEKIHETLQTEEEGILRTSEQALVRYPQLVEYLRGVI